MLKIQEIREIIKLVDSSSINEFVYEVDDTKVKIKKSGPTTVVAEAPAQVIKAVAAQETAPAASAEATPVSKKTAEVQTKKEEIEDSSLHKIVSPMVGTFYQAPSPDAPAFVKTGDHVEEESIVCIVEAMKLFNEIEAEVKGEIVEVLVNDGELVEYGQPLFLVKEN